MNPVRALILSAIFLEIVAIGAASLLVYDAILDVRAVVSRSFENGRALVARVSLRTEIIRTVALLALVAASTASALVLWDADPADVPDALVVALLAFDVAVIAILAQSVTVYRLRRRLFDYYRDDRPTPSPEEPTDGI